MIARTKFQREISRTLTVLKPPPKLTVREWADRNRYIARGTSAEAGKWSSDRLPYQIEPMDVMTKRGVGEVSLLFGAQLGKTELLLNAIGYFIDAQPASMLFLMPTLSTAQKFSQKKLAPMIAETPALVGKVKHPRERDSGNTILSKDFLGGSMVIAGSNSPSSLSAQITQLYPRLIL